MEDTSSFVAAFVEHGPGWMIAAGVIAGAFYVAVRVLKVWEANQSEKVDQNRELVEISGRMVDQMARSNDVIESVEKQMGVMNNTNATMVDALTKSQDRSLKMAQDTATIKDRVDFLYQRFIKNGMTNGDADWKGM